MTAVHVSLGPRLLGAAEAACYLGISERHLEYRRCSADFPHPLRMGRRLLWDRKILDEWVDALSGIGEEVELSNEERHALFGV